MCQSWGMQSSSWSWQCNFLLTPSMPADCQGEVHQFLQDTRHQLHKHNPWILSWNIFFKTEHLMFLNNLWNNNLKYFSSIWPHQWPLFNLSKLSILNVHPKLTSKLVINYGDKIIASRPASNPNFGLWAIPA